MIEKVKALLKWSKLKEDNPWDLWEMYGDTEDGIIIFGRFEGYASDAMDAARVAMGEWFKDSGKSHTGYAIQPVNPPVPEIEDGT